MKQDERVGEKGCSRVEWPRAWMGVFVCRGLEAFGRGMRGTLEKLCYSIQSAPASGLLR